MLVATDYFTKWAEAEAYEQVTTTHLIQFEKKNIVCRFGVPHLLVFDNRPQFIRKAFRQFFYQVWDQECLFITLVSPIKWAGRGHEQNTARVLEKALNYYPNSDIRYS